MGFRDVLLFLVTAGTNLQWVATAAAGGASAIVVWIIGFFAMALPLGICVIALSSRHPEEGGVYVWAKVAFGDFAGFITGWTYWMSNLPYFPGVLYFAAANALYAGGPRWIGYSASAPYFIGASLFGLVLGTAVNVAAVEIGKWLSNVGRDRPLARDGAPGRPRRRGLREIRAGDELLGPLADSRHPSEGRHLLVDDRVRADRPRVRLLPGRRDPRRRPHGAPGDPRLAADHPRNLRRRHAERSRGRPRPGRDEPPGHHAGDRRRRIAHRPVGPFADRRGS